LINIHLDASQIQMTPLSLAAFIGIAGPRRSIAPSSLGQKFAGLRFLPSKNVMVHEFTIRKAILWE
jgi:hypothetical protein